MNVNNALHVGVLASFVGLVPTGALCPPAMVLPLLVLGTAVGKANFDHVLPEYDRGQKGLRHFYDVRHQIDAKTAQPSLQIEDALWLVATEHNLKDDLNKVVAYKNTKWSTSIEKVLQGTAGIFNINYKDNYIDTINEINETINQLNVFNQKAWQTLELQNLNQGQKDNLLSTIAPRINEIKELEDNKALLSKLPGHILDFKIRAYETQIQNLKAKNIQEIRNLQPAV